MAALAAAASLPDALNFPAFLGQLQGLVLKAALQRSGITDGTFNFQNTGDALLLTKK